ncbi:MAG: tRNA (adenosine(37)-N6)-threonylcarbamoyltransferase complex ATPase subunit type 1 TsaE [Acidimicrobiales bacterium]
MSPGWSLTLTSGSPDETRVLGAVLGAQVRPGDLVFVVGPLGAGKTVFAQGFARALGVEGPVVSPTFTLVRQYSCGPGSKVRTFAHADLYRLDSTREVAELAMDELLEEDAVALVEWGDVGSQAMKRPCLVVGICVEPDGSRLLELEAIEGRFAGAAGAQLERDLAAARAQGSPR